MSKIKDYLLRLGAVSMQVVPRWFPVYLSLTLLEFIARKYILGISDLISLDSSPLIVVAVVQDQMERL